MLITGSAGSLLDIKTFQDEDSGHLCTSELRLSIIRQSAENLLSTTSHLQNRGHASVYQFGYVCTEYEERQTDTHNGPERRASHCYCKGGEENTNDSQIRTEHKYGHQSYLSSMSEHVLITAEACL